MSILGDARNRLAGDGVLQPQRSGGGATWESTKADAGVTRGSYTSAAACAAKGGTWIEAPGGAGYCELPKPKKRGGGGKPRFGPKKKVSKALQEEYKKNLEEVKKVLSDNIKKGYLTKEDAVAIYEDTKQLMQDAATGDISVEDKHRLDALRSGEDNSIVETASNLVDYETTKKITSGQSPNPNLPGNPANYPNKDFDGQQYFETKKQEALNSGDWSKAEEFGATEEEIIDHGGIKIGEEVVTEGPETWTETVWSGEPTTGGDEFGVGDTGEFDTGSSYDEDPIFADDFTDWQNDEYDWASEEAFDAWGNWEDSYSDTGWTDDSGSYVDDGWGENTGGIIKRRAGTNPAMYRAGGGMSSPQQRYNDHPGGPRGTDTVPAWLTEGEFVIDRDSTEKFAPLLKQINDWEPTSGPALKRKMKDDRINAKAFGKPMYRQEGGDVDPFARQAKEAFLAKSGRSRGARIDSGLDALGKSNQNQAAILGQAGLKGRSPGQLENVYGAVGEGFAEAGRAEGQYHDELGRISEAERLAKEKKLTDDSDMSLTQKMIKLLEQANPHLAPNAPTSDAPPAAPATGPSTGPHRYAGGPIYRQEGSEEPEFVPTETPATALDASTSNTHPGIAKFVSAVTAGNPKQIVDTKQEYDILVPLEFSNLDKATAKTRELIVTYEMYKSGTLTKEQYDQYVQTKWLGQKTEQNFDEYDSKVYRGRLRTHLQ